MGDNPPPNDEKIDEILFSMIDTLCSRFEGLSPFEVLNSATKQVFELWVDATIHYRKIKDIDNTKNKKADRIEWVNSKNATWH